MNSPFAWPGGKRNLVGTLLTRIPKHSIYVEVFAGSAKLLFAKPPSAAEVINDANGEVMNFFRVAKHRAAELAEALEHEIVHPERFRDIRVESSHDELARALRFAYTTWYSYGAKGEHFAAGNLGEMLRGQHRRALDTVRAVLTLATERLRRVRIEQRDFADMIQRFDSPETFFYLDPPYVHFKPIARYEPLSPERRQQLFTLLANTKGTFLMSFDDCEEVRSLAKLHGMKVGVVKTRYGMAQTAASKSEPVTEVLISSPARS